MHTITMIILFAVAVQAAATEYLAADPSIGVQADEIVDRFLNDLLLANRVHQAESPLDQHADLDATTHGKSGHIAASPSVGRQSVLSAPRAQAPRAQVPLRGYVAYSPSWASYRPQLLGEGRSSIRQIAAAAADEKKDEGFAMPSLPKVPNPLEALPKSFGDDFSKVAGDAAKSSFSALKDILPKPTEPPDVRIALKEQLAKLTKGTGKGLKAEEATRTKIKEIVTELELANKNKAITNNTLLDGEWRLIYTSSSALDGVWKPALDEFWDTVFYTDIALKGLGDGDPLVGDIFQKVNLAKKSYQNVVSVNGVINSSLTATWDAETMDTLQVRFTKLGVSLGSFTVKEKPVGNVGMWRMTYLDDELRVLYATSPKKAGLGEMYLLARGKLLETQKEEPKEEVTKDIPAFSSPPAPAASKPAASKPAASKPAAPAFSAPAFEAPKFEAPKFELPSVSFPSQSPSAVKAKELQQRVAQERARSPVGQRRPPAPPPRRQPPPRQPPKPKAAQTTSGSGGFGGFFGGGDAAETKKGKAQPKPKPEPQPSFSFFGGGDAAETKKGKAQPKPKPEPQPSFGFFGGGGAAEAKKAKAQPKPKPEPQPSFGFFGGGGAAEAKKEKAQPKPKEEASFGFFGGGAKAAAPKPEAKEKKSSSGFSFFGGGEGEERKTTQGTVARKAAPKPTPRPRPTPRPSRAATVAGSAASRQEAKEETGSGGGMFSFFGGGGKAEEKPEPPRQTTRGTAARSARTVQGTSTVQGRGGSSQTFKVGERIQYNSKSRGWIPGNVEAVNRDGTYEIDVYNGPVDASKLRSRR